MPAPYADHLEREHDFFGIFDDGVFSARVQLMKPDPAIFRGPRFGIAPRPSLLIDDVAHNVERCASARLAGAALPRRGRVRTALPPGTMG